MWKWFGTQLYQRQIKSLVQVGNGDWMNFTSGRRQLVWRCSSKRDRKVLMTNFIIRNAVGEVPENWNYDLNGFRVNFSKTVRSNLRPFIYSVCIMKDWWRKSPQLGVRTPRSSSSARRHTGDGSCVLNINLKYEFQSLQFLKAGGVGEKQYLRKGLNPEKD